MTDQLFCRAASFLSDRRRGGGLAVDRSVARSMLARLISESPPIGCLSRELVMDDERSTRSYLGYVMCGHSDGVKAAYGRLHNAFADIPFHIRCMSISLYIYVCILSLLLLFYFWSMAEPDGRLPTYPVMGSRKS